MKVVLFGASGMIGSRILEELLSRGHQVTAVVRNPEKVTAKGATVVKGDVTDAASVAAAISAYAPPQDQPEKLLAATGSVLEGLKATGVGRLIAVSGAGSLEVAPGVQLVDTPSFPAAWKPIALAHREALSILKGSSLEWSALSPAALIGPGERTGKFRLGDTALVVDEKGDSRISAEDYAVALVDELEKPQHVRRQFTVAY